MTLYQRHIASRLAVGFLGALSALVAVVWLTRALRELNVITAKGQTLLVFFEIAGLTLPTLITVITPFAFLLACLQRLNAVHADGEGVVAAAAGSAPVRLFRPFLQSALLVGIVLAVLTNFAVPATQRELARRMATVNADLVANFLKPGQFTTIIENLTFHIRSKSGDGRLIGVIIDDRRDPKESRTYLAEDAAVVQAEKTALLVMNGVVFQRSQPGGGGATFRFDTYGFDLSDLAPSTTGGRGFRSAEVSTPDVIAALKDGRVTDTLRQGAMGDLTDRLTTPLLPAVYAVITCLFLCWPRSTRTGRVAATTLAGAIAILFRGLLFAAVSASATVSGAVIAYGTPLAIIAVGSLIILRGRAPRLPRPLARISTAVSEALSDVAVRLMPRHGRARP